MSESRRKSAIWTQFNLISATAASCTICKAKLSTKGGTKHPTVQLAEVRQEPQPAPTDSSTSTLPASGSSTAPASFTITGPDPVTVATPGDPLRQRALDEMLAKMIAQDFQPYSIIEDTGFQQFTKELNPHYVMPSRKTLSNTIIHIQEDT